MTITCFSYVSIFLYARKTHKQLQKHSKIVIQVTDLRLLKTVSTLFTTFMLMWIPYAIVLVFNVIIGHSGIGSLLLHWLIPTVLLTASYMLLLIKTFERDMHLLSSVEVVAVQVAV